MNDGYKVYASQEWINKNNPIKTITKRCNIADLDKGTYFVPLDTDNLAKWVIMSNVNSTTGEFEENYYALLGGTINIIEKIVFEDTEEYTQIALAFDASGLIEGPSLLSIWDDVDGDGNPIHTENYTSFENPLNLMGFVNCEKFKTNPPEGKEVGQWYCDFGDWIAPMSSVPVAAVTDEIDLERPEEHLRTMVPSSLAVKNYVKAYVDEQLEVIDNGGY
jgi:hypothetical protein